MASSIGQSTFSSPQMNINWEKVFTVTLIVAIGAIVIFIAYKEAQKNNVGQNCFKNPDKDKCKDSLKKTAVETGKQAIPILGACVPNPLQFTCPLAMGHAFLNNL